MHAHQMIEQVPAVVRTRTGTSSRSTELLELVDEVITTAPEYSDEQMVMTPLDGVLDWTKATPAGFAFYRDPRVNDALRTILQGWCDFLSSDKSLEGARRRALRVVHSDAARRAVGMDRFEHDADAEHWASGRGTTSSRGASGR